jgi:hypothetical protein
MTPAIRAQDPMLQVERIGLAIGLIAAVVLMWPLRAHVTDDTYVHLQYARHLAQGSGPVFNSGEHVYGCTSPLWTALLADAIALGWNGLVVSRVIGFVATLVTIPLFLQLMRRTLRLPALRAFAIVAWAFNAWMLRWSTSGMETPLAVALTLAGFVAFTEGRQWGSRPVRTGALWSLAAMTRPEAVFLLVLWGILMLVDTNNRGQLRRLVYGLMPPIAIYGSWLLFARFSFGSFWPRSIAARSVEPAGFSSLLDQVRLIAETDGIFMLLLAVSLVFGGRAVWNRGTPGAQRLLPLLWIVSLPMLLVARGVPASSRYIVVLLPVLAWLAWLAADRWWLGEEPESRPRRTQAMVLGFAVMAVVVVLNLGIYRQIVHPRVIRSSDILRASLVHWGDWFGQHSEPGASIASKEVGALAYHSQRRVYDLTGFISPELEPHMRGGGDPIAAFAFAKVARPTFLVDRSTRAFDLIERSPYGAALTPLGRAPAYISRARNDSVYTFYKIDWSVYDTLRTRAVTP